MSAPKKLDTQTETQVVALIARGDTHQSIVDWLKTEKKIEISTQTVGLIKSRNAEALKYMKAELVKHETTVAATILNKSRRLIDKRLDQDINLQDEIKELQRKHKAEEIDDRDYYHSLDILLRKQLTVQELNQLSKESFNQSQIEAGKPTAITDNPVQAKANLETMLKAIAANDQQAMVKALFPDA